MINSIFQSVLSALLAVSGEGSWRLRANEVKLINALIDYLPSPVGVSVKNQLEKRPFIERSSKQIVLIRANEVAIASVIDDPEYDDALFIVEHTLDGIPKIANVTFYKGFIFSIELPTSIMKYQSSEVKVLAVRKGKANQTLTQKIDQAEHSLDM